MIERPRLTAWAPAREAPILLAVQLVTLFQAGFRGLDYIAGPGDPALDGAVGGTTAGVVLYAGVLLALGGIAWRRAPGMIFGHLLLGAWYVGLGWVALVDRTAAHPTSLAGVAVGAVGLWLLLRRTSGPLVASAGALAMLLGQALIALDLGGDYRTGTGLTGQGLIHLALAVGTFVLWQRRDLRAVAEREVRGD